MRVAIFFDRLGPYHCARLHAAGQRLVVTGIEVAGETASYDWDRVEGSYAFERTTLFPDRDSRTVSGAETKQAVQDALEACRPEVVFVHGWFERSALAAAAWCRKTGTPSVIMSETTAHDFDRSWWKETVKRRVVNTFQAGLVGGSAHAAYLEALGIPRARVFTGYDVVDNAHFTQGADAARADAEALRARLGLPRHYFLASNRFIQKKNLPRLVHAYADYRAATDDAPWDLVLLGDGPCRPDVEQAIAEADVADAVHLAGFKQYDELPAYYGLADAFVHASTTEQWGLVVNEAMASGLPVIVSERCGCAPDLVSDGFNGFTFDPYNKDQLATRLKRMAEHPERRDKMAQASRTHIADWGPEAFGEGARQAAYAAARTPTASSALDHRLLQVLTYR